MTNRLQEIVEDLPERAEPEAMTRLLERLKSAYDVDNAIYYALSLGGDRAGEEFGAMTYAPEWHQRYEDVNYREVDPVVQAAAHGFAPVEWRRLDWTGRPIRRLLAEAHEFRVGNHGFTIPIHGPQGQFAMFTISKACRDEDWDRLIPEISRDMLLLSHYIHRQVMDSTGASDATERTQKLSPRERDVLTMISAGRRRAQIADALGISESTLRVYIDSARHKLGALNSFHAVALAVKTGAIKV